MTLLFFEGFDNCSSFKDVSGIFKIGTSMLDDPRTIRPILTSGSVDSISPRNVGGSTLVLQSSYSLPTSGSIAVADLSLAQRQEQEGSSTQVSVGLVGSGILSSPFTFNKVGYNDVRYFGTLPSFVINSNGSFNFTAGVLRGVSDADDNYSLNFQIFRTRNSVKETMSTNQDAVTFPVKSGDVISFTTPNQSFAGLIEPKFWTVETTGVFFPSVSIDLTKNLTSGVIGFGYAPILPMSGSFGDGVENFTPIACLTDSQYRPHFFICNTNSGKIQLRKFSATNFINNYSLSEYYSYSINGSAQTDGSSQRYPRFLKSTTDPTLSIGGNDTNLTLIAESDVNKNTLVNNFWNYVELKFDMDAQDIALRINRKNTSTKNDLEFNGNNLTISTNPLTVLSGVFSGSGNYAAPYTGAISNSGIFRVNQTGTIFLSFTASWQNTTANGRTAALFRNGVQESIDLPQQGINNSSITSTVDYKRQITCVSGDIFGFTYGVISPNIQAYLLPTSALSDQLDKNIRYLVLGTMWGQNINGVSPASNLQWKTLLDDIYVIDSSGLPNNFIGSVSCGRIPYDQVVNNTASSGSLISVSDILSGSGGFTTPSGNGTLFFDAVNQEFNVKSSGFSTNNNNIVGIQIGMNGFSLNTEDYIGIGLDLPNNSGSYDYSPIVLSRNSIDGSYGRGPLYATDPSGNKWTEQSVRSATFKLKTFSE